MSSPCSHRRARSGPGPRCPPGRTGVRGETVAGFCVSDLHIATTLTLQQVAGRCTFGQSALLSDGLLTA